MKRVLQNKVVAGLLKFGIAGAIIGWLLYDAFSDQNFTELLGKPKDWSRIALAFSFFFAGVLLTFIRWRLLVRALGLPFTLKDSCRLGFLGYLFNFVAPGGVGGDLFKAVFIAREFHSRRAQAVATVFIDRVVGLYALFVIAAIAVFVAGLHNSPNADIWAVAWATIAGAIVGALFILMMLVPGFTSGRVSNFLGNLPRTGHIFRQLIDAVRLYRQRLGSVAATLCISVVVHIFSVAGFYLLGKSIGGDDAAALAVVRDIPTLAEYFVIVPLAMFVSAIPITPGGVGAFEWAFTELFPSMAPGQSAEVLNELGLRGLFIALIYRIITIVIALVGVATYFFFRREVSAALHDAEASEPESGATTPAE